MNLEILNYRKSIVNRSFWLAAGVAIIFVCFGRKNYAAGIIAGVFLAGLNFSLLSFQVARFGEKMNRMVFISSFLFRYGLLAVGLYFTLRYPQRVNMFGFLIGYFLLQLNVYISSFLAKSLERAG